MRETLGRVAGWLTSRMMMLCAERFCGGATRARGGNEGDGNVAVPSSFNQRMRVGLAQKSRDHSSVDCEVYWP